MREHFDVFVTGDEPSEGLFTLNFQTPLTTVILTAGDLLFARRILEFVEETRGNPIYRDIPLADGRFRRIPEKSVDLSASFPGTAACLEKDGEYDDSYVFRITPSTACCLIFQIRGDRLEALLESIQDVVDDWRL